MEQAKLSLDQYLLLNERFDGSVKCMAAPADLYQLFT